MIEISHLSLRYSTRDAAAVSDLSLVVTRGTLTALVGPNGSGKSTVVRALLRMIPHVQGNITVDGVALGALSHRERARILAVIPQREEPVYPLPVREYVAMGRLPFQSAWRGSSRNDEVSIADALVRAGVDTLADRLTSNLSGGEWQRARIARALAQRGDALILDEPTTFLDVGHEMSVFELARDLASEGKAVLLVSHQINLVARFADQMVLLHGGRAVASGPPADVMRAELLERVYEWPLVVHRDPATGAPALIPLRRR